jgi:hypothetical protein
VRVVCVAGVPFPANDSVRMGHTAGKRRGRPPGRSTRGRGGPLATVTPPIQSVPPPTGGKRRGRPPKTLTTSREQPARVAPPTPVQPVRIPVQPKQNPVHARQNPVQPRQNPVYQKQQPGQPKQSPIVSPLAGAIHNQFIIKPNMTPPAPRILNTAALNVLPVTEFNVWPVLEKLLAATQSMGMLLGSLKDDLKRTNAMIAAAAIGSPEVEFARKRREVATKLWRAFVAYKKSFEEIESFSRCTGGTIGATLGGAASTTAAAMATPGGVRFAPATQHAVAGQSSLATRSASAAAPNINETVHQSGTGRRRPRPIQSNIVIELSDSDDDDDDKTSSPRAKQRKIETDSWAVDKADASSAGSQDVRRRENVKEDRLVSSPDRRPPADDSRVEASSIDAAPDDDNDDDAEADEITSSDAVVASSLSASNRTADGDGRERVDLRSSVVGDNGVASATRSDGGKTATSQSDEGTAVSLEDEASDVGGVSSADDNPRSSRDDVTNNKDDQARADPKAKTELFSCLHFEPLFEIQPLNSSKS